MGMKKLNPKQERFCVEYSADHNGTQAAIRAGYSEKTAYSLAERLLRKVEIKKRVVAIDAKHTESVDLKADAVLRALMEIAFADIAEAFNDDGTLKRLKEMPQSIRRCIAGVDVEELFAGSGQERTMVGYVKKFRMWDKVKALEKLGQHLDLFVERVRHGNEDGTPLAFNLNVPANLMALLNAHRR